MFHKALKLFAIFLIISCAACKEGGNVAPGGSRLLITADPQSISLNGTSELTVVGTDEDGIPLPDGTQVTFSVTQAGSVTPSSVQLSNGTATTTYHASLVAGDITITAISGGVEATVTVKVADNIERRVFVFATPAKLPDGGGTSFISAAVTDTSGQPVADINVQFTTTTGKLQSNGALIATNNNGVATDTLNTDASATVTATTDDGFSGATTVEVGGGRIVCHMTVSTSTPKVGQTVLFFDTSDVPSDEADTVRFHWDFNDGSSADGQSVQHSYRNAGTFNVVHSVIDDQGNTTFCDPFAIQVSQ
ncbi:MAG TPA: PKD domain-containing protein [Acidobacteriota bacterium]